MCSLTTWISNVESDWILIILLGSEASTLSLNSCSVVRTIGIIMMDSLLRERSKTIELKL
mgnify:CR=1 FL=1